MISWGVKPLDKLTGGIEPACVTLVHGFAKSGKTTLAGYLAIVRIAAEKLKTGKFGENEIFLICDTDAGFSFVRLKQVAKAHGLDPDLIEDRIEYHTFESFEEQHQFIYGEKGKGKLFEKLESWNKTPLLVTLDGATVIYRNIIEQIDMSHRMSGMQPYLGRIGAQAHTLLLTAKKYNCPAFITSYPASQAATAFGEGTQLSTIIGGRNLVEIPKTIVRLMFPKIVKKVKTDGALQEVEIEDVNSTSLERYVRLEKSRDRPIGEVVKVKLSDAGFSEV